MSFYEFASFRLDLAELCLLRNGQVLPLPRKALEILALLVTHHGHLLTKDELMRRVWPDTVVEEGNLAVNMNKIRKVLGEQPGSQRYICTLPRRGYRFVADVIHVSEATFDSIAVLPFESESDVEYLSEDLTERILYGLSALHGLRVIPSSAIHPYRLTRDDPRQIAIRFGVSALLTGRLLVHDQNLVVSTELLDVRRNQLIWGKHYQHGASNLLPAKNEIALNIIDDLKMRVSVNGHTTIVNQQAQELYLRGRYYWNKRSEDALTRSIDYFKKSINTDKSNALSYAGLANSYNVVGFYTLLRPKIAFPRAKAAATRALALDPYLAEAHAALGYAKLYFDWNLAEARECFKRAIELNPQSAMAHQFYGNLLTVTGNFGEAVAAFRRALAIEPLSLIVNAALGYCYYFARRYDDAIDQCKNAMDLDRHFEPAHIWVGWAYQQKGMWNEAFSEYKQASKSSESRVGILTASATTHALSGNDRAARRLLHQIKRLSNAIYVSPYCVGCIYAALGDFRNAFESFDRAIADRSHLLMGLRIDPKLDQLRQDPRFSDLLRRVFRTPKAFLS